MEWHHGGCEIAHRHGTFGMHIVMDVRLTYSELCSHLAWVLIEIICCKIRMLSFTLKVKGSFRGHKVNSVLTGNVYCRVRRRYIHTTHHFESSDVDTPETRTRSDVVLLYIAIPETSIVDFKTRMSCHASPKVHLGFTRLIQ